MKINLRKIIEKQDIIFMQAFYRLIDFTLTLK